MRHSETCFLQQDTTNTQGSHYTLRWFTPKIEVNLCGHGTLSAAHVLLREVKVKAETLTFQTLSGALTVSLDKEGRLCMNFPQGEPVDVQLDHKIREDVATSFGIPSDCIKHTVFCAKTRKLVLQVDKIDHIIALKLNEKLLMSINFPYEVRGVAITTTDVSSLEDWKDCDFVSRYFNPWFLDGEDPVNGASHTIFGPYYQKILKKKEFKAGILSERTGVIWVEVLDNNRVLLKGYATTVLEGTIKIPPNH